MRNLFILLFLFWTLAGHAVLKTQVIQFQSNSAFLNSSEQELLRSLLPDPDIYFIEKIDIDGYCKVEVSSKMAIQRAEAIYQFLTRLFPDKGDYEIRIAQGGNEVGIDCATVRVYYLKKARKLENKFSEEQLFPEELLVENIAVGNGGRLSTGDILFQGNSALILESSFPYVQALAAYLDREEKMNVRLVGHVNGRAGSAYLKKAALTNPERTRYKNAADLSMARAKMVKDLLVELGVGANRIQVEGVGGKKKMNRRADSEQDHKENRRLEVFWLE